MSARSCWRWCGEVKGTAKPCLSSPRKRGPISRCSFEVIGYVYILANRKNGALYTGVTSDLAARMMQHRDGKGSRFCAKYGITRLVYIEEAPTISDAIAREKAIKKWRRAWKIELIEKHNPEWRDLFYDLNR